MSISLIYIHVVSDQSKSSVAMFPQLPSCGSVSRLRVGGGWKLDRSVGKCLVAHAQRAAQFSRVERNELRRRSQDLARTKELVVTHMGRKGLTDAFVDNLSIALKANEFVKVSIGCYDTSGVEIMMAMSMDGWRWI